MSRTRRATTLSCALLVASAACGGSGSGPDGPSPDDPAPGQPAPAPWSGAPLAATDIAPAYLEAWRGAENREECALLAFDDPPPATVDATIRTARFGGGWGVAYDLPELRSAFGVAGTGVDAASPSYDEWPNHVEWADGSRAGYGPEGGRGPNQLAYLRVAGEACLYNVWSQIGVDHLEEILARLRRVEGAP
jgi:hypothetical protein